MSASVQESSRVAADCSRERTAAAMNEESGNARGKEAAHDLSCASRDDGQSTRKPFRDQNH